MLNFHLGIDFTFCKKTGTEIEKGNFFETPKIPHRYEQVIVFYTNKSFPFPSSNYERLHDIS